jgi:hypothetical protein
MNTFSLALDVVAEDGLFDKGAVDPSQLDGGQRASQREFSNGERRAILGPGSHIGSGGRAVVEGQRAHDESISDFFLQALDEQGGGVRDLLLHLFREPWQRKFQISYATDFNQHTFCGFL